jgi:hypothetical protein
MKISARQRFVAALAIYLVWVAALATLALTSSTRPIARMSPPEVESAPNVSSPAPSL